METVADGFRPWRVFPSLCDWLDDEVPIEWLADFLKLMHDTPNIDWLLLTKRPENWRERVDEAFEHSHGETWQSMWTQGEPPENIWFGVSVENQAMAKKRIPELLKIPARIRFLSVEPMLGPIDFTAIKQTIDPGFFGDCLRWYHRGRCHELEGINYPTIDWAIFGGESGPKARWCNVEWIRAGVQQCREAGVAAFVKQLGSDPRHDTDGEAVFSGPIQGSSKVRINNAPMHLKDKKGGDIMEWPDDLRVREFPKPQLTPA